jgi:hypothetical protein
MRVPTVKCSFKKIPMTETEINLTKGFDLHELGL